jgi:hypothetical protein
MIVAKACFRLVQGGPMTLDIPPEIRAAEAHHADNPARSIRAASDIVPFLERADVLFVGAAYSPGGAPAMSVRLAIARGGYAILDKLLAIYGDRAPSGGDPKPFTRMPIVYEKAFGGIGLGDNPLGMAVPNIVHPDPARQKEPAGYGPISWYWPSRKRLLRGHPRQALEQRIVEIPDGFDVSFFQAAPEDQRIPFLAGDEAILLQGLHPRHASLETRLPGARAMARVYTKSGMGRPFPLVADTVYIDGDADQCSITWRGSFPVTNEDALADLCVAAGLEVGGAPIEWPDRPPVRQAEPAQRGRPMQTASTETVALSGDETTIRRPAIKVVPFAAGARSPALPAQGIKPAAPSAPREAESLEGTLLLDESSPPPLPGTGRPGVDDSTVAIGDSPGRAPREIAAPFRIAASGSAKGAPAAPIPGAPWAGPAPAPSPKPSFKDTTVTLADDDKGPPAAKANASAPASSKDPAAAPPKEAPAPPPPPEPEKQAAPDKKPTWSWAPQPEAPPPPPATTKKASPPPPPPKPAVKSKIYGSFGEPKKK